MKTVITSKGNRLSALFDQRFGRAAWFCVVDEESWETTFVENPQAEANGGVGMKVVEKMVELGVEKVISGDFGPRSKSLMEKFQIQMVIIDDDHQTIKELIQRLKN